MKNVIDTFQKIIPSGIEAFIRRYEILKGLEQFAPIGRRSLADKLNISERVLRNDTDYLKKNGFIEVAKIGMSLSKSGHNIIIKLDIIMNEVKGITYMEEKLQTIFGEIKVMVVPGNADEDNSVKDLLGKEASNILLNNLKNDSIVAITGGSTVQKIVQKLNFGNKKNSDVLVVPARGGVGKNVDYHANTLASKLALKIGASYMLLNVPDNLREKALKSVEQEPEIKTTISYLSNASIVIFGIGDALKMAEQRNLPHLLIEDLKNKGAVGEAFGYYFNQSGEIVYKSRTIGVKLESMKKLPFSIAVAGGYSKAKAIIALRKYLKKGYLIIDEGAAKEIITQYDLMDEC